MEGLNCFGGKMEPQGSVSASDSLSLPFYAELNTIVHQVAHQIFAWTFISWFSRLLLVELIARNAPRNRDLQGLHAPSRCHMTT